MRERYTDAMNLTIQMIELNDEEEAEEDDEKAVIEKSKFADSLEEIKIKLTRRHSIGRGNRKLSFEYKKSFTGCFIIYIFDFMVFIIYCFLIS